MFAELCAGTGALSLRLHRQNGKPPISRQGSKVGYADAILRVLGLRPGEGAGRYMLCEPDAGVRLLLRSYADSTYANMAADILESWAHEDPRSLWSRLRSEGPLQPGGGPREYARWLRITTSNRLINLDPTTWLNNGKGGSTFGGPEFCTPILRLADAVRSAGGDLNAVLGKHACMPPADIPRGTICYMDPPYEGTSPYTHDLPRDTVIDLAIAWHHAGATVCISEAEPIPELQREGWFTQEISWCKRGHKRSFSKQQREWLTLNQQPRHPGKPRGSILQRKRGKIL